MLKIRISGTQKELEKITDMMEDAEIRQFKHKNGQRTFSIDTVMTVEEFLAQNESIRALNEEESMAEIEKEIKYKENIDNISQELNDLLDVISEESNE